MADNKESRAICVIPARGGSKRIPRKNIREFAGKPLIAHPIGAALESGMFTRVVVSTDDEEIAEISRAHGAQTPFLRDASLANDFAGTAEVILDAIQRLGAGHVPFVCCLYPTAPLITAEDLRQAGETFISGSAETMVCVTAYDFAPLRAFRRTPDDRLAFNWPEHALTRSQDLPELVHDAGAFYWMRTQPFLEKGTLVGDNTIGFPLSRWKAVDIDTEEDFAFARFLHGHLHREDLPS